MRTPNILLQSLTMAVSALSSELFTSPSLHISFPKPLTPLSNFHLQKVLLKIRSKFQNTRCSTNMAVLVLVLVLPILYVAHVVYSHFTSPLKNIPGPFIARYTNLWRFFDTLGGRVELSHILLHAKYGPVVRLYATFPLFLHFELLFLVVGSKFYPYSLLPGS